MTFSNLFTNIKVHNPQRCLKSVMSVWELIIPYQHVNSSPIGMGTLCSTLRHLPYITSVDGRGVCGVFCRSSHSLAISRGSNRVWQAPHWRFFTRYSRCCSRGLGQSLALRNGGYCREVATVASFVSYTWSEKVLALLSKSSSYVFALQLVPKPNLFFLRSVICFVKCQ